MPTYVITAPDGEEYEITAPEGASEAEVLAYAQQNYSSASTREQRQQAAVEQARRDNDPTEGMSGFDKFMAGVGKSVADTGRGIGQLVGLVDEEEIAEARRTDAALMNTGAGTFGNLAGGLAQTIVPLGGGARLASLTGRAAPYLAAGARGAAYNGAQGTIGKESRVQRAALGGAAGIAGQGIASGVGRALQGGSRSMDPVTRRALGTLEQARVPVHASQVSQSKGIKTTASALSYLPMSGAGKAAARQQEAFNRAVGRTFGADAAQLSDEVMTAARQKISAEYEDIFARSAVKLDDKALSQLGQVEKSLRSRMTADEAAMVKSNIDDILANSENGVMPGQVYQSLRGALTSDKGAAGKALKDIRSILDQAAYRSVGAKDAARLQKANSQWANMRTTEKSLQQVEGAKGNVRPASLWPLIRNGSTHEMRELARAGQTVLKDPIPDSGTAARMAVYTGLAGAGGAGAMSDNPAVSTLGKGLLLGITAGRALNSPAAARFLANGASPAVQGLARRVTQPLPYVLPAIAGQAAAAEVPLELDVEGGQAGTPEELAAQEAELVALQEEMRRRRGY